MDRLSYLPMGVRSSSFAHLNVRFKVVGILLGNFTGPARLDNYPSRDHRTNRQGLG